MKKYFYIFVAIFSSCISWSLWGVASLSQDELRSGITPSNTEWVIRATAAGEEPIDAILMFIRDTMFGLLLLITVWVFLFLGGRLLIARWNPEEFKKALIGLVYAGVWLFIVAFAYAAVRFIAWINIL